MALIQKYKLTETAAERMVEAGPSLAMEVEELELPSTTSVQFNIAPKGQATDYKVLDELSKGQKASALLLLLLLVVIVVAADIAFAAVVAAFAVV